MIIGIISWNDNSPSTTTADTPPTITINSKTWTLELALTPQQTREGLSGRAYLAGDEGMLFIFPNAKIPSFWMKDCLIDLDIAFIDANLTVVSTATMPVETNYANLITYSPPVAIRYALEVAAGQLAAAGVKTGDTVIFTGKVPFATKAPAQP